MLQKPPIRIEIFPIESLNNNLPELLFAEYRLSHAAVSRVIGSYLSFLRSDLWVLVEYPYVDRIYRDSYYTYFASKNRDYPRDTVRIALFSRKIRHSDFRNGKRAYYLQQNFLGYFIIRPTYPNIIGRSMISPVAFSENSFCCCLTRTEVMVNGVKLLCNAFPHASQDTETQTCAETSIWSVMEYFGTHYDEYTPAYPSEILASLVQLSYARTLPSEGLSIVQISRSLRDFHFATKVYSRDAYTEKQFHRILNYYVGSGIPVVTALAVPTQRREGHAVVIIGFAKTEKQHELTDMLRVTNIPSTTLDTGDINQGYVVIDDNYPPYRIGRFASPCQYYNHALFQRMEISGFVVPLYKRIYLEAIRARYLVAKLLTNRDIGYTAATEIPVDQLIVRFFLTSSRSFKNRIALNPSVDVNLKDLIILCSMPKFIWVAEIATQEQYLRNSVSGVIIIDATGNEGMESLCFVLYPGRLLTKDKDTNFVFYEVVFEEHDSYQNNLKGEWNEWQA